MKLIAIALLTTFSLVAFGAPKKAQTAIQKRVDRLALSPDQKAKVDPITDTHAKALTALKGDAALSDTDRKKKTAELRKDTETKLRAALTADQWKKYREIKAAGGGKKSNKKPPQQL